MLATVVVAPVVVEVVISLTLVLACLVSLGFLYAYRATIKQLLAWFADKLDAVSIGAFGRSVKPFGSLAAAVRSIAERVDEGLSAVVGATSGGVVYLLGLIGRQVRALTSWVASLAETVEIALQGMILGEIPRALRGLEALVLRRVYAIRAQLARLDRAIAVKMSAAIGAIDARVGWAGRRANDAVRRVGRLERAVLAGAAVGIVATALSRLGMGFLGCRNVKRLGKRACAMDSRYLDALVADSLLFFGTFSLVQFADELADVAPEVSRAIRTLTRAG